jgi:hypothetical protein
MEEVIASIIVVGLRGLIAKESIDPGYPVLR